MGEEGVAAVAEFVGLQGSEPAALLLVEAAEQQVHLAVDLAVGMVLAAGAIGALALLNYPVRHGGTSASCPVGTEVSIGKVWD